MFNLNSIALGGLAFLAAAFFGLWQLEGRSADTLREARAEFKAKYENEVTTALEWKEFAERQAAERAETARREGAAAEAETERKTELNWAYARIRELQNEVKENLPDDCGGIVLRDAELNRLYNYAIDRVADPAAAGNSANVPTDPDGLDGAAGPP